MEIYVSASSDIGSRKSVNQDSLLVRKLDTCRGLMCFAILCDGMGGLQQGELASAAVTEMFSAWMYERLPLLCALGLRDESITAEWGSVVSLMNDRIREYGLRMGYRLGTTLTGLLLSRERYYIINIGDSRAYRLTPQETIRLTRDHTLVADEIARGNLSEEQAEYSSIRHLLTRCIGLEQRAVPDYYFGTPMPGDSFILCSDGLRHRVSPEELRSVLYLPSPCDQTEMRRRERCLIEEVKRRGETDNISVITIHCRQI